MNYTKNTERMIQSFESKLAWGGLDRDQALQEAIDGAFDYLPDEARAELYTRIVESWDSYAGAPRKLWMGQIVSAFMSERTGAAFANVKVRGDG